MVTLGENEEKNEKVKYKPTLSNDFEKVGASGLRRTSYALFLATSVDHLLVAINFGSLLRIVPNTRQTIDELR